MGQSPALPLAIYLLATVVWTSAQPLSVPLWGRCELSISNTAAYRDSYRDVSLDVRFTRPDGSTVAFWGFYDGEHKWRIRFMPDKPGCWRYEAKFGDGSPGASGEFICVESDLQGPISVHAANPVWFGHRGGKAALIRGLHVGDPFFARNWDDPANPADGERRRQFLDWAQARGYNLISVASFFLNRDTAGRGKGWATPRLWPLEAQEYHYAEGILEDLSHRKIAVFPFAGFFGRNSTFPTNAADQALYLRYIYARFGAYGNLLLNVGGPEPLLRNNTFLTRAEVNRLGTDIQRLNVFERPVSVHNQTGNDEFLTETWPGYGVLQGPKTADRLVLSRGLLRNHHARRPLIAQETLWSGNQHHIRAMGRDYTNDDLRKHTLVVHFSSAALVFADNDGDSSSGFTGTLDLKDCRTDRHVAVHRAWDLCAEVPFGGMQPLQSIVSGDHAFCLADPGREYAVYWETSEPATVRLEEGRYRATWMSARGPEKRVERQISHDQQPLVPPEGGDDWLLLLKRIPGS